MKHPLQNLGNLTRFRAAVLAGALAISLVGSASAQDGRPGEDDRPAPRAERPETPEALRRLVDRQLERAKRQQSGLEEVRAMIDRGEPVEAVRAKLRETLGPPGGGENGGGPGAGFRDRLNRGGDAPGPGDERPVERFRRQRDGAGWPGLFGGPGEPGGPRGPEGGPDRARPDEGPMTEQRLDRLIKFVEQNRPEMAKRLRALKEKDPEALRAFLRDKGQQIMRMMRDADADPALFAARRAVGESERQSFEAARAARSMGDGEEKTKAVERLREALKAQFDARTTLAQLEIAGAKARAEALSKKLDEAVTKRDAFLDERFKKALSGEELMDPPMPEGPGGGPARAPGPGAGSRPR